MFVARERETKILNLLKVEKVGFVNSSGFAEKLPDVEYLNLNSLFFEENYFFHNN